MVYVVVNDHKKLVVTSVLVIVEQTLYKKIKQTRLSLLLILLKLLALAARIT